MMNNRDIRAAARQAISKGWFWRVLISGLVLNGIVQLVSYAMKQAYSQMNIATMTGYAEMKLQAIRAGLDSAIPSTAMAGQMAGASLFQFFIIYVFSAIALFGCAYVALKAVRNDTENWFAGSFGGFSRPFEVTWLLVIINLKAFLWSLLFIIPGIIAVYRYRLAWYLKNDNPEWSASQCIAESCRLMKGYKWQAFRLDLSILFLILSGLIGFTLATVIAQAMPLIVKAVILVLGFFCVWWVTYSAVYLMSARAVMYEELKKQ